MRIGKATFQLIAKQINYFRNPKLSFASEWFSLLGGAQASGAVRKPLTSKGFVSGNERVSKKNLQ